MVLGVSVGETKIRPALRDLYCMKSGCSSDDFEEEVLKQCLYPQARMLYPVLSRLGAGFFRWDRDLIHWISSARDSDEFSRELAAFNRHHAPNGMLRNRLRLRLSRRRLKTFVLEFFPQ
jgi:hypothetical protein